MKATLHANGRLSIEPESGVEAYAMTQWIAANVQRDTQSDPGKVARVMLSIDEVALDMGTSWPPRKGLE